MWSVPCFEQVKDTLSFIGRRLESNERLQNNGREFESLQQNNVEFSNDFYA